MMLLPALYHWSPKERRLAILQEGLKIYSDPVAHSPGHSFAYICFGPTPSIAWALSGDIMEEEEYEAWDLWMYRIRDEDSVYVRPNFGGQVEEIKIRNSIPPGCLWYVATRESFSAIEIPPPKPKRKRKARKKK